MPTAKKDEQKIDFLTISRAQAQYNLAAPFGYKRGSVKYVFVTGGVISGLGKGLVTASIVNLLQARGYNVVPVKFDGYLNVDAGTMNPIEHGEVFVLDDGTECDMDLGFYERFLNLNLKNENNITTGKIFKLILEKERRGDYLGKTVQIVPHLTAEIKNWIRRAAMDAKADICVVEVGGTVGDIESAYFLEAAREFRFEEGMENVAFVHTTLVPVVTGAEEQKSKPTQHSVRKLMELGIQPNVIVCRTKTKLSERVREKIALFSNVPINAVISDPDFKSLYEAPLFFEQESLVPAIERVLGLESRQADLEAWKAFVQNILEPEREITVAITGKYTELKDSYISIIESVVHAAAAHRAKVNMRWIETTDLSYDGAKKVLADVAGVIVPGGFGARGTEGKINCIRVCREQRIPYLGLCYGMQLAVIEFARNVCGLVKANTAEIDPKTPYPVIDILPEQKNIKGLGGSMRLGLYPAVLKPGSLVSGLYGATQVQERHRHRFEVNPAFIERLEKGGLVFSGRSPDGKLMEFVELPQAGSRHAHPFFVGTQAHPEFRSRPLAPHPLYLGFVQACLQPKAQIKSETKDIELPQRKIAVSH